MSPAGDAGFNPTPYNLIRRYDPARDDNDDYTKCLWFLKAIWPPIKIKELAPRATLRLNETEWQKIQKIDINKLVTDDDTSIKLSVETLSGRRLIGFTRPQQF